MITVRPEWVMVGFPARPDLVPCAPGQVAILASTTMAQAQMEYTARTYDFRDFDEFRRSFKPHHTIAIELDDFVVVVADTYAEALAKLFASWMPPERMALPAADKEIPTMTYPATGHGPSVPAGGVDESDSVGPSITAMGITVPRAVYHDGTGYHAHADRDDTATSVPVSDSDRDDGLPDVPRYEGPDVSDADNALPAPMVNPSAGNQGPPGGGVNPVGADQYRPGMTPDSIPGNRGDAPYPDTTVDRYPR